MNLLKILGALLLILSGVGGGYMLNSTASVSLSQTDSFLSLLRYIKGRVDCFSLPISEIFSRCDKELFSLCGWKYDRSPKDIDDLLNNCEIKDMATEKILLEFSSDFGMNYREEQIRRCEYYISLLEDRRERIAAELPTKKKLNSTLCIAAVLAVVIIMI